MSCFYTRISFVAAFFLLLVLSTSFSSARAIIPFPTPTPLPGGTVLSTPVGHPNSKPFQSMAPTECGGQWTAVPSADLGIGAHDATLLGIAVVAANDIWAVGQFLDSSNRQRPVIEHWDGTSWSVSLNPAMYGTLHGITVVAPNDIWAVGTDLIERWNGTNWSVVPSQHPGNAFNTLYSVVAVAPDDVWAVGVAANISSGAQTLAEHWDGTAWSLKSTPNPSGGYNELYGVRAVTSNNVWAVGYYNYSNPTTEKYPLIAHWDGTIWSTVTSPGNTGFTYLRDLAVLSASDIWAVGTINNNGTITPFEHWNGNTWNIFPSTHGILESAAVVAPNDIWAVGGNGSNTLTEHWNGSTWNVVASQNPSQEYNTLSGVAAVDSSNLWAVGWINNGGNRMPLMERYSFNGYYSTKGDDTYGLIIPVHCTGNLTANININRFYGPLDSGADTGRIRADALGTTVENQAHLKISYIATGADETITVNFAGVNTTRRLPLGIGMENTTEIQIPTTNLILPRAGTYTSLPPNALNPISITGDQNGRITRIRLELKGMRPLVLAAGFHLGITNPDHDLNESTDNYFAGPWTTNSLGVVSYMVERPQRDGHASIVDGGRSLGDKIAKAKMKYGVGKVNILGHSMGGLWGREFASNNRTSIDKVMMLGTPNRGSIIADALAISCASNPALCGPGTAYARQSPAIYNLTGGYLLLYNLLHGQTLGVNYIDLAGVTNLPFGRVWLDDGAVGIYSERALAYSTHLPAIAKDQHLPFGIVHNQEPSDNDFKTALAPYYGMGANRYNPNLVPMNRPQQLAHTPLTAVSATAQYPAFTGSVQSGQIQSGSILIDKATSASFAVGWFNYSSTLSLTLHDPTGQVITPTSIYSGSSYLTTLDGGMYTIQNPLPGNWQVDVSGDVVAESSESFYVAGELTGGVQISPIVSSIAPLGQPLMVTATLSDTALLNGASVTATVSLPSSGGWSISQFPMIAQGNGNYQGTFTPTMTGTHLITIFANGVNSQGQRFSRTQTTQIFVGSGATLTGGFSEQAYDSDGDGLYNNLVISTTVNVSEAGVYRLGGYLTKADGSVVSYSTDTYTPTIGTATLPLSFEGSEIGQSLADGPYQLRDLYLSRIVSDELGLALVPNAYSTNSYTRYDWQRDNVLLAGAVTDQGTDSNGNGLYDYLQVRVPLDVHLAGVYSASLNLAAPDGTVITSIVVSNLNLTQGTNMLTARFPGLAIGGYGVDGPYQVEDLSLMTSSASTTYIASVLPQTHSYYARDFEGGGCIITFSDVQTADYFYTPVQYLACRGIISGYSDGTFRPYNQTTRAQLSKIVVGGEGWPIDMSGGPHFTDVAVDSTFYNVIETAYHHGIISGYSDGTFRPSANVTRGQLSKIIVGAQGWPAVTTGGPHFNDVAADSIFYGAIETAYAHGIIGGYNDGTFRPGNSATRGQIAKIVYLALQSP